MACDGYSKQSLMGNWYEERQSVAQLSREQNDYRSLREEEEALSFVSNTNKLQPLGRTKRLYPWNTKGVLPYTNNEEFKSIYQTQYDNVTLTNYYQNGDKRNIVKTTEKVLPRSEYNPNVQTKESKDIKMLNLNNLPEALEKHRNVKNNITDFGSTFKKHNENYQRFYGMTSYQESFSRPLAQTAQDVINEHQRIQKVYAGGKERPFEEQGVQISSALTAEYYKNTAEPKNNTAVQRSWLPFKDKSLIVAEANLKRNQALNETANINASNTMLNYKKAINQVPEHDIGTSLPLKNGEYEFKDKYPEPGAHRKIRTDVTVIRNKALTKK